MLSSLVKIIYHHCYGYLINHAFHTKNYLSEMVWYLIGVYIINRTLHVHGRLEIQNFSAQWMSGIFFLHEKRNFVSPCSYVISSMYCSAILFGNILDLLTCFKFISPERIKNMDTKNVHFSEIHVYYLAVGHSVRILYLRLMPTTSSLLYSARIM